MFGWARKIAGGYRFLHDVIQDTYTRIRNLDVVEELQDSLGQEKKRLADTERGLRGYSEELKAELQEATERCENQRAVIRALEKKNPHERYSTTEAIEVIRDLRNLLRIAEEEAGQDHQRYEGLRLALENNMQRIELLTQENLGLKGRAQDLESKINEVTEQHQKELGLLEKQFKQQHEGWEEELSALHRDVEVLEERLRFNQELLKSHRRGPINKPAIENFVKTLIGAYQLEMFVTEQDRDLITEGLIYRGFDTRLCSFLNGENHNIHSDEQRRLLDKVIEFERDARVEQDTLPGVFMYIIIASRMYDILDQYEEGMGKQLVQSEKQFLTSHLGWKYHRIVKLRQNDGVNQELEVWALKKSIEKYKESIQLGKHGHQDYRHLALSLKDYAVKISDAAECAGCLAEAKEAVLQFMKKAELACTPENPNHLIRHEVASAEDIILEILAFTKYGPLKGAPAIREINKDYWKLYNPDFMVFKQKLGLLDERSNP